MLPGSVGRRYEYHLVGITESVWCSHCNLPSMLVCRYVLVARLDPTRWLGQLLQGWCRECGSTDSH